MRTPACNSTSIGHQIGGETHAQLVDSFVRMNLVPQGSCLEKALRAVDRGHYSPPEYKRDASEVYANRPLKIGVVATISTPQQHAQVLGFLEQHLQPGMTALDVGSGSGYLVAVMAHLVGSSGMVTGVDIVPELVEFSKENLQRSLPKELLDKTLIVKNDGKGMPPQVESQQFDCVHVGVAVQSQAEAERFLDFVKPGGGLLIPLGHSYGEQKLVKMTKHTSGDVEKTDIMSVLCQPMLDEAPVAVVTKTRAEKLSRVEEQLKQWRDAFEAQNSRKPTREDMMGNAESKELFMAFASLRK